MKRFAIVFLVACGGGGDSSDPTGVPDGPAPHVDAPSARNTGSLFVEQATLFGTPFTLEGAEFFEGSRPAGGSTRTDGPCTIRIDQASPPPVKLSAGTVTLAGSSTITLALDGDGSYEASQQALSFAGGSTITFAATGGGVPAFSTQLSFPTEITVPGGVPSTVSKSGLSLSWSGAGTVQLVIGVSPVAIVCVFTGVQSATIPASTLSDLEVGADDGSIALMAVSTSSFEAGAFDIETQLFNVGALSQIAQVTP